MRRSVMHMAKPRIEPVVWYPSPPPTMSPIDLPTLEVFVLPGVGPEDVLVAPDGTVLTGLSDGRIVRVNSQTHAVTVVADTGGRPLGLEWLSPQQLLICDAILGLLVAEIDRDLEIDVDAGPTTGLGKVETLLDRVNGRPLRVCNNASVAEDGSVWFTDSTSRFDFAHWKADLIEHRGTGRLIRLAPDGEAQTISEGLQFANGVALAPDGSAVYVAQTGSYCIDRIALHGSQAGRREVFVDNLPGFPDNLSISTDGLLWVALASRRVPAADFLAPRAPWIRRAVWRAPAMLQPAPDPTVAVMAINHDGEVIHEFVGTHPEFAMCTAVRQSGDDMWLGSLTASTIARFSLAEATTVE